jgi:P pilus assembly chaperone PapD
LVLVPAVLLTPSRAAAQLAVGRVEVVMQPGDTRDAAIGVRNESDKPVQALVRLED